MQIKFSFLLIVFFLLLALISYYQFDISAVFYVGDFIKKYPDFVKLGLFVQYAFKFSVWIIISSATLIFLALRSNKLSDLFLQRTALFCFSIILTLTICFFIKITLGRYRPILLFSQHLFGFSGFSFQDARNSFPSSHSALIFCIASYLTYFFRSKLIHLIILFLAIVLAATRVIILKHYPSDVLVGASIGIISSTTIHYLYNYYFGKPHE